MVPAYSNIKNPKVPQGLCAEICFPYPWCFHLPQFRDKKTEILTSYFKWGAVSHKTKRILNRNYSSYLAFVQLCSIVQFCSCLLSSPYVFFCLKKHKRNRKKSPFFNDFYFPCIICFL